MFNLEVQVDHVYHVAVSGVLVHDAPPVLQKSYAGVKRSQISYPVYFARVESRTNPSISARCTQCCDTRGSFKTT